MLNNRGQDTTGARRRLIGGNPLDISVGDSGGRLGGHASSTAPPRVMQRSLTVPSQPIQLELRPSVLSRLAAGGLGSPQAAPQRQAAHGASVSSVLTTSASMPHHHGSSFEAPGAGSGLYSRLAASPSSHLTAGASQAAQQQTRPTNKPIQQSRRNIPFQQRQSLPVIFPRQEHNAIQLPSLRTRQQQAPSTGSMRFAAPAASGSSAGSGLRQSQSLSISHQVSTSPRNSIGPSSLTAQSSLRTGLGRREGLHSGADPSSLACGSHAINRDLQVAVAIPASAVPPSLVASLAQGRAGLLSSEDISSSVDVPAGPTRIATTGLMTPMPPRQLPPLRQSTTALVLETLSISSPSALLHEQSDALDQSLGADTPLRSPGQLLASSFIGLHSGNMIATLQHDGSTTQSRASTPAVSMDYNSPSSVLRDPTLNLPAPSEDAEKPERQQQPQSLSSSSVIRPSSSKRASTSGAATEKDTGAEPSTGPHFVPTSRSPMLFIGASTQYQAAATARSRSSSSGGQGGSRQADHQPLPGLESVGLYGAALSDASQPQIQVDGSQRPISASSYNTSKGGQDVSYASSLTQHDDEDGGSGTDYSAQRYLERHLDERPEAGQTFGYPSVMIPGNSRVQSRGISSNASPINYIGDVEDEDAPEDPQSVMLGGRSHSHPGFSLPRGYGSFTLYDLHPAYDSRAGDEDEYQRPEDEYEGEEDYDDDAVAEHIEEASDITNAYLEAIQSAGQYSQNYMPARRYMASGSSDRERYVSDGSEECLEDEDGGEYGEGESVEEEKCDNDLVDSLVGQRCDAGDGEAGPSSAEVLTSRHSSGARQPSSFFPYQPSQQYFTFGGLPSDSTQPLHHHQLLHPRQYMASGSSDRERYVSDGGEECLEDEDGGEEYGEGESVEEEKRDNDLVDSLVGQRCDAGDGEAGPSSAEVLTLRHSSGAHQPSSFFPYQPGQQYLTFEGLPSDSLQPLHHHQLMQQSQLAASGSNLSQLHAPQLAHWTQNAARLLLPHSMRDMADLLWGDGWRPGLADTLPGGSPAGGGGAFSNGMPAALALSSSATLMSQPPQQPPPWHCQQLPLVLRSSAVDEDESAANASSGCAGEAAEGVAEMVQAANQRLRARPLQPSRMPPMPPAGLVPRPGPHRPLFSKLGTSRAHEDHAAPVAKDIPASEVLSGRHPPPHVRQHLSDRMAVAKLMASLPGVDPRAACVRVAVAALAGQGVPATLLASSELPAW